MSTKPGVTIWPAASSTRVAVEAIADVGDDAVRDRHIGAPAGRTRPVDDRASPDHHVCGHDLSFAEVTAASVSREPGPMASVPPTMPAAIFMGLRDVTVEDRPTPVPGAGELLRRGQPLRNLRLRPALPPRMGDPRRQVGSDRGPRVRGHGGGDRRRRHRLGRRRPDGRRAEPALRQVRVLPGQPHVALHRARARRRRRQRLAGRVRRLQGRQRRRRRTECPTGSRSSTPR